MTWQPSSLAWPNSAESIQTSTERGLAQVPSKVSEAVSRIQAIQSRVVFSRNALSEEAQALLGLRKELEELLTKGQVLCVHPYQHGVGSHTQSGHHLTPEEAVEVLVAKLHDTADKYHPKGQLHVVGWMITENTLARFSQATKALYDVVNISELGMLSRRVGKAQTLQSDKMTKPPCIAQPRFKPAAYLNQAPLLGVEHWQGAQIAQLESLASDRQTPVDKLAALAQKRSDQLATWSERINGLKLCGVELHKFNTTGTAKVIATKLQQSSPPSRAHNHTFACLFISPQPLTFVSELFDDPNRP
ncbi:TPA: hypothetical protein NJ909_001869 [Vibrio parahaemolyticus]|nr:hypothetical protein [Vibrio parahaemolyticus]MBE5148458.1 hypothetical protein [Vibrio parahaemolyticus]HCG8024874.1 hypothetical protein [Vibrio parahaemolyticus]